MIRSTVFETTGNSNIEISIAGLQIDLYKCHKDTGNPFYQISIETDFFYLTIGTRRFCWGFGIKNIKP